MSAGVGPQIHMVVARDRRGVIGDGVRMLWSLRDDLAYFKRVTMGSPIVMGRRTWAAIGRPLAGRRNLVLSRQAGLSLEGAEVLPSVAEVLEAVEDADDAYVIGGGEIYRLFLPYADSLHITEVDTEVDGSVTFPDVDPRDWRCVDRGEHPADDRNEYAFTICRYER